LQDPQFLRGPIASNAVGSRTREGGCYENQKEKPRFSLRVQGGVRKKALCEQAAEKKTGWHAFGARGTS